MSETELDFLPTKVDYDRIYDENKRLKEVIKEADTMSRDKVYNYVSLLEEKSAKASMAQEMIDQLHSEIKDLEDQLLSADWSKRYEEFLKTVDRSPGTDWYYALGLCGEAGEIAEKIKKSHRDGEFNRDKFLLELGDVLWYMTRLANIHGSSLEEIAAINQHKLQSRKDRNVLHGSGDTR